MRTEAVFQTPDPRFDRTWVLVVPSYDSAVTVDLLDANNDRIVGRFETSVVGLMQVRPDAACNQEGSRSIVRYEADLEFGRLLGLGWCLLHLG